MIFIYLNVYINISNIIILYFLLYKINNYLKSSHTHIYIYIYIYICCFLLYICCIEFMFDYQTNCLFMK